MELWGRVLSRFWGDGRMYVFVAWSMRWGLGIVSLSSRARFILEKGALKLACCFLSGSGPHARRLTWFVKTGKDLTEDIWKQQTIEGDYVHVHQTIFGIGSEPAWCFLPSHTLPHLRSLTHFCSLSGGTHKIIPIPSTPRSITRRTPKNLSQPFSPPSPHRLPPPHQKAKTFPCTYGHSRHWK